MEDIKTNVGLKIDLKIWKTFKRNVDRLKAKEEKVNYSVKIEELIDKYNKGE